MEGLNRVGTRRNQHTLANDVNAEEENPAYLQYFTMFHR
jgi:hypothetical protein